MATLNAGTAFGLTGYARSGSSLGTSFGSWTGGIEPWTGFTVDYLITGSTDAVSMVGNTVATFTDTSFTVNGTAWAIAQPGSFNGTSTDYVITTSGPEFSNGVSYTVLAAGGGAPIITSPNTDTNALGTTLSHALTANESVTWSIVGGADQALFEISGSTLRWVSNGVSSSLGAKVVQVRATAVDDGQTTDQTITVTVFQPYAGPTFVGVTSGSGSASAVTIDFTSSGRAAGDLLFIPVMTANQAITISGWTEVPTYSPQSRGTAGAAGGVRLTLFSKVSTGTETTVTTSDSGDIQYAVGFVVRGASSAAVAVDIGAGNNVAATTSGSFGGVTTTVDDCLVASFVATDRDAAAASWTPTGYGNLANGAERFDNGTSTGTGGGVAIFTGEKQAAGATGNITATQAASAAYCWITLALKNVTASNNIAGSTTITITPTGAMTGRGSIAGAATVTIAPTAALIGRGAVAGAASFAITPTAAISGVGLLTGSTSLSLTPTGAMTGRGALTGSVAISLAPSAALVGKGAIAGSTAFSITPAGAVVGSGQVAGSASLSLSPVGVLSGVGAISGSADLAIASTGTLSGTGAISGAASITFSLSGSFGTFEDIAGSASFALSASGGMSGYGAVSGSLAFSLSASGTLPASNNLFGSTSFSLSLSGTLVSLTYTQIIPAPVPPSATAATPPVPPGGPLVDVPVPPGHIMNTIAPPAQIVSA